MTDCLNKHFLANLIQISGKGVIVQIDETISTRRKYKSIKNSGFFWFTIVSDLWKACRKLGELPESYVYLTVNHLTNYVDLDTGACTNSIESIWQKLKQDYKKSETNRGLLKSLITEYVWRKKFHGPDIFYNFWKQVSEQYPLNE